VRAAAQVLPISGATSIAAMLPLSEIRDDEHLVLLTAKGHIKKTALSRFASIQSSGLTAIKLKVRDCAVWKKLRQVEPRGCLLWQSDGRRGHLVTPVGGTSAATQYRMTLTHFVFSFFISNLNILTMLYSAPRDPDPFCCSA
jgi:DNA gyrase/topoisomerase IV subunit A